jgi:nitrogenase molybdenum-cofactor synthesis protein NifE
MAGPSACLRHSAFMAHARGFTDRFHMLCVPELDMTMGRHLEKIEQGILDIARERREKVIFLIMGCPDYILGTDFTGVIARLEAATGRRVILGPWPPSPSGSRTPLHRRLHQLFRLPQAWGANSRSRRREHPGTFMPLSEDGELYGVLRRAGVERIRQIPLCANLAEFAAMAEAARSLVLHPLANSLATRMAQDMGIPARFVPTAYGFAAIAARYAAIEETMGRSLDTADLEREARKAAAPLVDALRDKTMAVGCAINGSPYELAVGLVDLGLRVEAIFGRGSFAAYEWTLIEKLRETAPHIRVYNVSHPALCGQTAPFDHIDVAYGVDAGMFCAKAANVPLSRYQEQKYGYENALWMLERTHEALRNPVSNHDWIYKHQFLI